MRFSRLAVQTEPSLCLIPSPIPSPPLERPLNVEVLGGEGGTLGDAEQDAAHAVARGFLKAVIMRCVRQMAAAFKSTVSLKSESARDDVTTALVDFRLLMDVSANHF